MDANGIIIVTLDAVAWTFNLRGNDVDFNPVAVAYGYVSENEAILFINREKLTEEDANALSMQGVTLRNYQDIFNFVANLPESSSVCITGSKINYKLHQTIPASCRVVDISSPIDLMKSVKNETELNGFRNAMIKDGVALVKFFMWLEKTVPTEEVTEVLVAEKLLEFRSQQDLFVGESFSTIAGYGSNGAVIHYHAMPDTCLQVKPEGLLLIDSGGQYKDGTTDITAQ